MSRLPLIAAFLVLCFLPCAAAEPVTVSVRFLSFPKSPDPVKLELRTGDGKSLGIEAPSNEFSEALNVLSTGVWVVGETLPGADGKPVFREYGRTVAPASPDQMLLFIRKGKENSDGFDLIALDARLNAFGGGAFLFMNATKVDIAGKVGEEKFALKAGQHVILKAKAEEEKRTAHAMFYFRKEDEVQPFFSSRWPVVGHARCMVFFYHEPGTMQLRMHTIRDFL